jgi:hypothetical protein
MWYQTLKHMSSPIIRNYSPTEPMSAFHHRMTCNPKHRHLSLFGHNPPVMFGALEEVFMSYRPHGAWRTMEVLEELA